MLKLQEELKSGNISVGNSKRFGRFDDYFLPQEQWAFRRETFFQRSGLPSDPKEVAGYLKARLNRAYDLFLQTAPGNSYASVDEDGWCLSVDTPEKPGKEADAGFMASTPFSVSQENSIRMAAMCCLTVAGAA
jgi:hypothetical protein